METRINETTTEVRQGIVCVRAYGWGIVPGTPFEVQYMGRPSWHPHPEWYAWYEMDNVPAVFAERKRTNAYALARRLLAPEAIEDTQWYAYPTDLGAPRQQARHNEEAAQQYASFSDTELWERLDERRPAHGQTLYRAALELRRRGLA